MTHEKLLLLDGKKINCRLNPREEDNYENLVFIKEGEIAVVTNDRYPSRKKVFICQNEQEGAFLKEEKRRGYKYSWIISSDSDKFENSFRGVFDIEIIEEKKQLEFQF